MATPRAYLITAAYNLANFRSLTPEQHAEARSVAVRLFPVAEQYGAEQYHAAHPVASLSEQGVLKASSFASDLFSRVPGNYHTLSPQEQRQAIDAAFELGPLATPVGWMAVVQEDSFLKYITAMGSSGTPFLRMYDLEVRSLAEGWTPIEVSRMTPALRNDRTTDDIYWFMTPTNWRM